MPRLLKMLIFELRILFNRLTVRHIELPNPNQTMLSVKILLVIKLTELKNTPNY